MRSHWTGYKSVLAKPIEDFVAHKRSLGRRFDNEAKALRILDRFLVENEIQRIEEITSAKVDSFLASRPRLRPRSFNHLLCTTRRLFDWMVNQGIIAQTPVKTRPRRQGAPRIPFIFGPTEAHQLLQIAGTLSDNQRAPLRGPTYYTIFALLYGLGLRVGEATRLQLADVDRERQLLVIRESKFAKSRLVPMGPRLASQVQAFIRQREGRVGTLEREAPLFSFTRRGSVHPGTISQTFHQLVPKLQLQIPAGTAFPRVHDLRHAFAVGVLLRWYRAGINPYDRLLHLSTFLGHVDPASTAVYLTITNELLEEANHRFEKLAASVVGEVPR